MGIKIMASPKYKDKYQEAVARAYKKALNVIQKESPPDSHSNAKIVAAAHLTPLFIEIDLDECKDESDETPQTPQTETDGA